MHQLILYVLFTSLFYQEYDNEIIWKSNNTLKWSDFKGKVNPSSPLNAISSIGYLTFWSVEGDTLIFETKTVFDTEKSWVKEGKNFDDLLNHENYHLNIQEIYSRIVRQKVKETEIPKQNVDNIVKGLVEEIAQQAVFFQKRYDQETDHARDARKQRSWQAKIDEELNSLSAYKDPIVKVRLKE